MIEAISGFALGNLVAIAIAILFVHRKWIEMAFFPIVVLINSIPVVAKAPILVLLLGNGMAPKIAIAAIICFFPTLVNMVRGLEAISPQTLELMHVLSAQQMGDLHSPATSHVDPLSVLGTENRRQHLGGWRDRRRVDRLAGRHRRADHPGDLQFRQCHAVCHRDLRVGVLCPVLPDHSYAGTAVRAMGPASGMKSPLPLWEGEVSVPRPACKLRSPPMLPTTYAEPARTLPCRLPRRRGCGRRRPGWLQCGDRRLPSGRIGVPDRALSLSRRPRVGRHGPRAG